MNDYANRQHGTYQQNISHLHLQSTISFPKGPELEILSRRELEGNDMRRAKSLSFILHAEPFPNLRMVWDVASPLHMAGVRRDNRDFLEYKRE